jgi:hypothetical protein
VDTDLSSSSESEVEKVMFGDGVALYGAFVVCLLFVAVAFMINSRKHKATEDLAHHDTVNLLVKSFLAGLSFGLEAFLIVGIIEDATLYGAIMLAFRLLHFLGGSIVTDSIFGSCGADRLVVTLTGDSASIRKELHQDYSRANVPLVGAVVLLSFFDVTMSQFLPFRRSKMNTESRGYPTLGIMKFCVILDAIATIGSVCTQISFLNNGNYASNPATSDIGKAVFSLNIVFSIAGTLIGFLFLCIKREGLQNAELSSGSDADQVPDRKSTEKKEYAGNAGGTALPDAEGGQTEADGRRGSMTAFTVSNPMLNTSAGGAPSTEAPAANSLSNFGAISGRNSLAAPKKSLGGGLSQKPPPPAPAPTGDGASTGASSNSTPAPAPPPPPAPRTTLGGGAPPPPPPSGRPSAATQSAEMEFEI